MLELVAERGCGYVLMHIEGPPRVDRPAPALRRRRRAAERWFARADRAAVAAGVDARAIAIDPGLDFDLTTDDDLEILRRLGELHALGRPLFVSLSRKDFLGAVARRLVGGAAASRRSAGRRRWPRRRSRSPKGPRSSACTTSRRSTRCARPRRSRGARCSDRLFAAPPLAWERLLEAGEIDDRLVDDERRASRARRATVPLPRRARARARGGAARAAGVDELYAHQLEALEAARAANVIVTSGTASGKSLSFNMPVLDAIARDPKARALYLYPTKALAQDQARKLSSSAPRALRHAIYDGDTPREERAAIRRRSNLILTNPDMLNMASSPTTRAGATCSRTSTTSSSTRPTSTAASSAPTSPTCCGGCAASPRIYGAEPRFILTSATIANPVELAERLVGDRVPAGRLRRRPAGGAADRDLEPAADRRGRRGAAARRSPSRPSCSPTSSSPARGRSASCAAAAGSS